MNYNRIILVILLISLSKQCFSLPGVSSLRDKASIRLKGHAVLKHWPTTSKKFVCSSSSLIFNTNALLFGSERRKITSSVKENLLMFQNKCLRHILLIFLPNTISNAYLRNRTGVMPLYGTLRFCRWRWLDHVCH